ncbi:hypothetical protein ACFS2C_18710 [Prauserella oleivorans]|uniref:Uncharacterized protein n=1 Tax=Prauserella oleivorans TaxID=1478153 RepID=A0ABW5WD66_9PSEU
MRSFKDMLRSLTEEPRGFNADGRVVGLGLATAQDKARRQTGAEAEDYLRGRATDDRRGTPTR